MPGIYEVGELLFHLLVLDPFGHEVDRHHGRVHLGELADLAPDAVLERLPLAEVGLTREGFAVPMEMARWAELSVPMRVGSSTGVPKTARALRAISTYSDANVEPFISE